MDTLVVTGHVSGKKYAIPTDLIGPMQQMEYGTRIDLKIEFGNKLKHIECLETLQEIVQTLAAMN